MRNLLIVVFIIFCSSYSFGAEIKEVSCAIKSDDPSSSSEIETIDSELKFSLDKDENLVSNLVLVDYKEEADPEYSSSLVYAFNKQVTGFWKTKQTFNIRAVDKNNPLKSILKLDAVYRPNSAGVFVGLIWYNMGQSHQPMFESTEVICTF